MFGPFVFDNIGCKQIHAEANTAPEDFNLHLFAQHAVRHTPHLQHTRQHSWHDDFSSARHAVHMTACTSCLHNSLQVQGDTAPLADDGQTAISRQMARQVQARPPLPGVTAGQGSHLSLVCEAQSSLLFSTDIGTTAAQCLRSLSRLGVNVTGAVDCSGQGSFRVHRQGATALRTSCSCGTVTASRLHPRSCGFRGRLRCLASPWGVADRCDAAACPAEGMRPRAQALLRACDCQRLELST